MLEVVLPLKMQGTENESSLPVFQSVDSMVHKYFMNTHKRKCIEVYIHVCIQKKKKKVIGDGHRKLGKLKITR